MVRLEYIKADCRWVASVHCKDISSNDGINGVFNELNIALNQLQEKIGEPQHWYFLIDIVPKGVASTWPDFHPYEPGDPFLGAHDAWQAYCPRFWTNASKNPQFRRRIMEWIDRLEETLKLAETRDLSTAGLWEHDETQFGQPLLTHLALSDVQFVPEYTRFLRLWEMSHQVNMGEAVVEMVDRHGITPETEALILCYTEVSDGDEHGLLELIGHKEHHTA